MTPLKTAALALTLIIVTPILLGFGMASEDLEREVSTTEHGGSLSELVLNDTTPYYISYSGVNNNLYLYDSDGATLTVPDFVETSADLYTYTPIYGTETGTLEMSSAVSVTYDSSTYSYLATSGYAGSGDATLPDFVSAKITVNEDVSFGFHIPDGWADESLSAGSEVYIMAYFDDGGTAYYRVDGLTAISGTDYYCDAFIIELGNVTLDYVSDFTAPSIDADPWSAEINGYLSLEINDGTDIGAAYIDATGILYSGEIYTISSSSGTDTYSDVTGIALAPDVSALTYETSGAIQSYADVSYGWNLPTDSDYYYWFNGYDNNYIRMMVHIESGESLYFADGYLDTDIALVSTDGYVTLSVDGDAAVDVGTYTNLMLEIYSQDVSYNDGYVVVTGIYEWPSIGTTPTHSYNSVTVDLETSFFSSFSTVYLDGSVTAELRVDATGIYAGEYPSTNNYVYRPYSLYPSDDWQSVVIDSVGLYGDYLLISGTYCSISEDNTITFTDLETSESVTASVLGLTVDFKNSDSSYETYVDGHLVAETSSPFLQFGGLWSLTLHRTVTTEETVTMSEWVPGAFAFDKDDFILITILATVGVFVALGLYKGTRVGVLAVVCAAAGIIAFVIA